MFTCGIGTFRPSLVPCARWVQLEKIRRCYGCGKKFVLGIETSCDDTGAAVVDQDGRVLGESLNSQLQKHIDNGGIVPPYARDLHQENIKSVVDTALENSRIQLEELSAVATTVRPGLSMSLAVGLKYSQQLVRSCRKPFIPIHHMEAHALTIRMIHDVPFPFLVLLASGGHCQLALVKNVDEFLLLGTKLDNAPGDILDKVARRLKLKNLPQCSTLSGGQAIEHLAHLGDPKAFSFPYPLSHYRTCNFSFAGLQSKALSIIIREESKHGIVAGGVLPNVADVCASFQHAVAHYLVKQTQRAMVYCEQKLMLPNDRWTLVLSGGVACNQYVRAALQQLCDYTEWKFLSPPPKLCTDNGIMIAWNGMERLQAGIGIAPDPDAVVVIGRCSLGTDLTKDVQAASIKLARFKLDIPPNSNSTFESAVQHTVTS